MCNHYRTVDAQGVVIFARSKVDVIGNAWETRGEAWPKASMPLVYRHDGKRLLASMRWGVWPWFETTPRLVTNARDDKLMTSRLWQRAGQSRRCIVPADGFYQPTGPAGAKWEVLFRFSDDRPFWFAGRWSSDPADGGNGFALVTGRPNELVAALPHDRMPVILDDAAADEWLSDQPLPAERLQALCTPHPAAEMVRQDMPRPVRATRIKSPALPTAPVQSELF